MFGRSVRPHCHRGMLILCKKAFGVVGSTDAVERKEKAPRLRALQLERRKDDKWRENPKDGIHAPRGQPAVRVWAAKHFQCRKIDDHEATADGVHQRAGDPPASSRAHCINTQTKIKS